MMRERFIEFSQMEMDLKNEINQLQLVAAVYRKHCKFSQAERVYKTLIDLQEQSLGTYSEDLAVTLYRLAEVYDAQGKNHAARPLYRRAVEIWQKLQKLGIAHGAQLMFFMDAMEALQRELDYQDRSQSSASA